SGSDCGPAAVVSGDLRAGIRRRGARPDESRPAASRRRRNHPHGTEVVAESGAGGAGVRLGDSESARHCLAAGSTGGAAGSRAPSLLPAREGARAFAGVGLSQPAAARSRARRAGLPGAARATDAARGGAAARGGRAAAADAAGLGRRRGRSRRCHRRSSGGGLAGLVLLVLRAEPMGDHLLVATLLAARLVARLWKLAVLPLVVVEETVALRLVRALASLDAALQAFLALRLRGLGLRLRGLALAAVGLRLCHLANAPERKGAGFYPVCRALTMARTLHTPPGGAESACPIGGGGNGNGGSGRVGGRRPRRSGN